MPRSTKSLDEQLEEARKRVVDLARRKRLEEAKTCREKRIRRLKQGELIARRWWARHDALAAADPEAAGREWQEVLADMDANLRVPSERRLFGLEPLAAEPAPAEEPPGEAEKPAAVAPAAVKKKQGTVRIWTADGPATRPGRAVYAATPSLSEGFSAGMKPLGGKWSAAKRYWHAAVDHYDQVVALARDYYEEVELVEPPTG